jgi:hypothetical protein
MPTLFLPGTIPGGKNGSTGEENKQHRGVETKIGHAKRLAEIGLG